MIGKPWLAFAAIIAIAVAGCRPQTPPNIQETMRTPVPEARPAGTRPSDLPTFARMTRAAVLSHAPHKQYDPTTGHGTESGRTPAAACDAMAFLVQLLQHTTADPDAAAKLNDLGDWVIDLQRVSLSQFGIAAVPSTPDAPPPENRYFYAIDAAICGAAMLAAYRYTREPDYLTSAIGFGNALDHLGEAQERVFAHSATKGAFCEYARPDGNRLAYNCDSYVKTLLALGFLKDLAATTGTQRFRDRARMARAFLLPGLLGAWEYASAAAILACDRPRCPVRWRRVPGPDGEPDRFVYGDTLAYALAGLHAYDSTGPDVASLYRRFAGYEGHGARTGAFDGGIAFAGYMDPTAHAPDPHGAYYDLVTIGILSPLRRDLAPEHDARAWRFLERLAARTGVPRWGVGFDGEPIGIETVDLTTLSKLGAAALEP